MIVSYKAKSPSTKGASRNTFETLSLNLLYQRIDKMYKQYTVTNSNPLIERLRKFIDTNHAFIAGSYAVYMAGVDITPNDIDIFTVHQTGANEIIKMLLDNGMNRTIETDFYHEFIPTIASVFQMPIQVIMPKPSVHSHTEILDQFDFSICRAILYNENTIIAHPDIFGDTAQILKINGVIRTVHRIAKYQARGYKFTDSEVLKLFMFWDGIDPNLKHTIITEHGMNDFNRQDVKPHQDFDYPNEQQ